MKTILFALCLFISLPVFGASRHADGDYVIILNGNESPEVVRRQHGVGKRPNRDKTWDRNNGFHGFSARLTGAQADRLENDTRVAVIEPDVTVQLEPDIVGTTGIGVSGPVTSRYGGTGSDGGHAVTVDKSGNIYAAGWFGGTASFGTTNLTSAGGQDLWITKTDPIGTLLWVKGYGGTGDETVTSIAVGIDGSIYLGGYFTGTANFGGTNCPTKGSQDIFIAKYTGLGAHVWSESFGSTDLDSLYGLAVDVSGNVYFTGTFRQTINFGGGVLNSILGGDTGYLAKFDTTGAYVFANRFNGTSANYGRGIGLDSSGNILVTGYFFGSINLGGGALTAPGSAANIFVGKFNSAGVYTWGVIHGDTHTIKALTLAVDPSGNAVVGGEFNTSTDLGGGTITSTAIYLDTFIARYASADGAYQWGVRTAGNLQTQILGVATDNQGNVAATGYLYGNTTIAGITLTSSVSSYDILLIRVNASGSVISAQIYGSSGTDQGYAVTVDSSGHPIITGNFQGTLTANGTSITSAGTYDAFLLKLGQIIPTGVSRIGTLLNTTAHIAGVDVNRVNADVAVIDTGVQLSHPDLNVYTNVSFVTGAATGNDDNGHGTHVAGIIGALDNQIGVVGVAPGARLWAVKVMDSTGLGQMSDIISGVDWVTQHASSIEVANMSLGGQGLVESLRLAIEAAVGKGVVVVVAAGNSTFEIYGGDRVYGTFDDFFPACYPSVCTVSAMADSDGIAGGLGASANINGVVNPDDTQATFSNYSLSSDIGNPVFSPGAKIDLAAPGVNIYSTSTNSTYKTLSGTSMASPHVAGGIALYIAANGRASDAAGVATIRQEMVDTAEPQSRWGINPTNPNYLFDFNPEGLLSVSTFTPSGASPVVAISTPANYASYASTNSVFVSGTATDAEDGTLTDQIVWTDSVLGRIGTGSQFFARYTNSLGNHTISARVTDSDGNVDFKSVQIVITNAVSPRTAPQIVVTCPTNHANLPASTVLSFTCTANDTVDGDLKANVGWYLLTGNGPVLMGNGTPISIGFIQGNYSMILLVTNTASLVGNAQVNFYCDGGITNTPPQVAIQSPANGASFLFGAPVTLAGTSVDDLSGNLDSSLAWSSSLDGALGVGAVLTNSTLTVGSHTITATSVDGGTGPGTTPMTNSASVGITIFNNAPGVPTLGPVISIGKGTYHTKEKATITCNVKSSGTNVPNASISMSLRWSSAGLWKMVYNSGLTDSSGNFVWIFKVPNTDRGTNYVSGNASKSGYNSASTTATFQVIK